MKTWCLDHSTIGMIEFKDFKCFTLELPWNHNQKNISCIKAGTYRVVKHLSPSNGWVMLLIDVEDRTEVQIHSANFTRQIKGCIVLGDSIKHLDSDNIPDVTNSKATLAKFLDACGDEETIRITRVADYDFMSV